MQIVSSGLLTNYLVINPKQKHTLLILHGWGQTSKHWQTILDNLPVNITGIALDLPAFGSTQPLSGTPDVSEYADFVKNFITKLRLKNVTLLGQSFGGQIAVDFSLRYPQFINHLILVSPACVRQSTLSKKSQTVKNLKPLLKYLSPKIYDYLFKKIASPNYLNSTPTQRAILNKIIYQDYSDKLKDIKTPTSIIWGDKDITISNQSKFLAEKIPNSHLFVLYGADHRPHLTSPQKFIPLLNSLLEKKAGVILQLPAR